MLDPTTKRTISRTIHPSQFRLCATLPSLRPQQLLPLDVPPADREPGYRPRACMEGQRRDAAWTRLLRKLVRTFASFTFTSSETTGTMLSEALLALRAPSSSRCDFCQVSFCGMGISGRCVALAIAMQSPHSMTDVVDLIQSSEIYDCFERNTAEVELMIDYITTQRLSPKQIYRQVRAAHKILRNNCTV